MKTLTLLLLFFFVQIYPIRSQVKGCKDPQASNFNPSAQQNDGSCLYAKTTMIPHIVCPKLNDTILESSGLIFYRQMFWTHNDSDNPPYIYAFDSLSGNILHKTFIAQQTNTDWEDMTQDSLYIYIGDFGNNNGSRTDLNILRIRKTDLKMKQIADTVTADKIHFSFGDQTSFNNSSQNHDFDMEAFCVLGDSLHLFSKNWVDKKTRHYVVSKDTGTYILQPVETFLVNGQITGACADEKRGIILLTGYSKTDISCFAWLFWDYQHNRLNNGNKRRLELGTALSFGQNEGLCFRNKQVYISNEKYLTDPALRRIDIEKFMTGKPLSTQLIPKVEIKFSAYQSQSFLIIKTDQKGVGKSLHIYTSDGQLIKTIRLEKVETSLDIDYLMEGVYLLEVEDTVVKIYIRK